MLSVPQEKTLLIRLNRPKALNAMTAEASEPRPVASTPIQAVHRLTTRLLRLQVEADMCRVLDWFEATPSLWVCILTGTGR